MSVNGVVSTGASYEAYATGQNKKTTSAATTNGTAQAANMVTPGDVAAAENGVVYEPSNTTEKEDSAKKTYTQNTALVQQMKADAREHAKQLQNIVQQLITKQGQTFNDANDMWRFLASGKYEVDAATKAQAQEDISEDGYWGVKQTSDRIIDFATALTGGDPDKIEEMREAFKKGYEQAEKTWGGELPEISKKTYEAVMEKFDKLAEEANSSTTQN